jgi:hypothetical protein
MSKSAITRLFALAVVFTVVGAVIGTVAVVAALLNGAIVLGGPQVVTVNAGPIAGAIAAVVAGSLLAGIGTVASIGAWVAALFNTSRLADKTWFTVLLVLGAVSFGWIAMIAYVFAGPDGTAVAPRPAPVNAPSQG